ncbi:BUD13 isoform X1 [Capsicum chacoense]
MVGPSSASTSLKEYLKKYESNNNEEEKKKQKKKKKVKPNVKSVGVVVVDEDPVWQKPVKIEDEEDESADEELPQVNEDIEVKRMKRLEQLRARRPFGSVSEDGSGWVSVSSTSNNVISDEQVSDLSPPRKRLGRNDSPSPEPQLNPSSSGADYLSPPRKPRARNDTPSPESGPNQPRTQEGDLSPPRKRSARNDLPKARIHSPSPESQLKPSSSRDADLSPPRKRRVRNDTPELEMKSLNSRDVDVSPPRRRRIRNDTPSPESKARSSADLSPPRRRQKQGQSLLDTSDVSPPRRGSHAQGDSRVDQPTDLSPLRKARPASSTMKQGPKTGLVSGKDIKKEIDRTKKEDWLRFQEMDPLVSGRNAEPVYRDKITGQRMSKEEFLKSKKKKEEKEKPKEIKLEWGKGLAQKREMEVRLQELESEKDKPFARTRDDPELDTMLKERVRWGDPMAHLVKKKQLDPILPDFGANEKMKDSGFIIPQVIPSHSWIKRGLDAAPNRYGIRPGRHWDGVDRSTGYEKNLFKSMNEKQATEREAYLWSVSDM